MKLCKDCKHCQPKISFFIKIYEFSKCKSPKDCDMVTGKGGIYCSTARKYTCLPEAKNFEPK